MKAWHKLLIIAIVLLGIFLLGRASVKTTENIITIGDGITFADVFRDMTKPKFPHLIFIPSDDKIDTFIIYADTPFGEIPQQVETGEFPIPVSVNDKPDPHYGTYEFYHTGIADSVLFNISEKRIIVKESVKRWFNWYAGLNVWIDQAKHLSADIEGGLMYKRRFGLKVKVEADHEYRVKLKVGICVGI